MKCSLLVDYINATFLDTKRMYGIKMKDGPLVNLSLLDAVSLSVIGRDIYLYAASLEVFCDF